MLSINKSVFSKMKDYALSNRREEMCGLVVCSGKDQVFVPCENQANDRSVDFSICPKKFISHDVGAVFHSHPKGSALPSRVDRAHSDELGVPFVIYSIPEDNFKLYNKNVYKI